MYRHLPAQCPSEPWCPDTKTLLPWQAIYVLRATAEDRLTLFDETLTPPKRTVRKMVDRRKDCVADTGHPQSSDTDGQRPVLEYVNWPRVPHQRRA